MHRSPKNSLSNLANGKLLLVIRIRGVKDIAKQQKLVLNKLGLRQVNTAVFVKATQNVISLLKTI